MLMSWNDVPHHPRCILSQLRHLELIGLPPEARESSSGKCFSPWSHGIAVEIHAGPSSDASGCEVLYRGALQKYSSHPSWDIGASSTASSESSLSRPLLHEEVALLSPQTNLRLHIVFLTPYPFDSLHLLPLWSFSLAPEDLKLVGSTGAEAQASCCASTLKASSSSSEGQLYVGAAHPLASSRTRVEPSLLLHYTPNVWVTSVNVVDCQEKGEGSGGSRCCTAALFALKQGKEGEADLGSMPLPVLRNLTWDVLFEKFALDIRYARFLESAGAAQDAGLIPGEVHQDLNQQRTALEARLEASTQRNEALRRQLDKEKEMVAVEENSLQSEANAVEGPLPGGCMVEQATPEAYQRYLASLRALETERQWERSLWRGVIRAFETVYFPLELSSSYGTLQRRVRSLRDQRRESEKEHHENVSRWRRSAKDTIAGDALPCLPSLLTLGELLPRRSGLPAASRTTGVHTSSSLGTHSALFFPISEEEWEEEASSMDRFCNAVLLLSRLVDCGLPYPIVTAGHATAVLARAEVFSTFKSPASTVLGALGPVFLCGSKNKQLLGSNVGSLYTHLGGGGITEERWKGLSEAEKEILSIQMGRLLLVENMRVISERLGVLANVWQKHDTRLAALLQCLWKAAAGSS